MQDLGRLLLRLAIGGLMLLHGIGKLRHGVVSIGASLASHGIPSVLAYLVFAGELAAPVFILVGLYTRPAGVIVAINMVVAVALMHRGEILHFGRSGGYELELPALYLLGGLAIALLGTGRYSINHGAGRWS